MELNKNTITEIFRKNFQFPIVETIAGTAIKMDALNAFHFCNITGAGYLDDPTYPFSPKGVMKILREAFQYNIVTGIFDRNKLFYSPTELVASKEYLFNEDKYVLILECNSEMEFQEESQKIYDTLICEEQKTTNFIIFRVEAWKNGNGMECFLEYLACEHFKKKGYIVENQIPLVHAVGSPDFGGFKLKNTINGFHIVELSMLRITHNTDLLENLSIEHVIVGEAKTATTIMAGQLEKYLNTRAFYKGYEMHPEKQSATKRCFGMLNVSNDYSLKVEEPSEAYSGVGEIVFDYNEYLLWYENNLKFYIIANLTNEELKKLIESNMPRGKYTQQKIIDFVKMISLCNLVKIIKEVL